eukprot:NODE_324_length_9702_cov_1.027491.p9 type:complete len:105 gc:universal NODE_324_length_9702_cov_1.027491:5051-5365(+)
MFPDESLSQVAFAQSFDKIPICHFLHAFDRYSACYTASYQLGSLFRYGSFPDCTQKWKDFKFALSLTTKSKEDKLFFCKEYFGKQTDVQNDQILRPKNQLMKQK